MLWKNFPKIKFQNAIENLPISKTSTTKKNPGCSTELRNREAQWHIVLCYVSENSNLVFRSGRARGSRLMRRVARASRDKFCRRSSFSYSLTRSLIWYPFRHIIAHRLCCILKLGTWSGCLKIDSEYGKDGRTRKSNRIVRLADWGIGSTCIHVIWA